MNFRRYCKAGLAVAALLVSVGKVNAGPAAPIYDNVIYSLLSVTLNTAAAGGGILYGRVSGVFELASDSISGFVNGTNSGTKNTVEFANLTVALTGGLTFNFYYNVAGQVSSTLSGQAGSNGTAEVTDFFKLTDASGDFIQLEWSPSAISHFLISGFDTSRSDFYQHGVHAPGITTSYVATGTAIPEPASLSLLAIPAFALVRRVRRQKR